MEHSCEHDVCFKWLIRMLRVWRTDECWEICSTVLTIFNKILDSTRACLIKNQKLFILTKSIWKQGIKIPDRYMQVYHNGSLSFDTLLISRTAFLQDAALYKATSHKNVVFLHSFWMESSLLHHFHGCILILCYCYSLDLPKSCFH